MKQSGHIRLIRRSSVMILAGGLITQAGLAQEEQEEFTWSGYVQAGGEYNSNLNISELETATGDSDVGLLGEGGLDATWRPAERWRVDGGYSYTGSRYKDVDELNLDLHMFYGDASYEFDFLTVGGNYYHADANLDGNDFLKLDQYSVYAGRLLSDQWYLRGALNFSDKNFDTFDARDADTDGFSVDGFWFFNAGQSSLNISYAHEDEDTRADRFDYDALTLRFRFNHDLTLLEREATLQAGYRWHDRDYDSITPAIDARRDDTHSVADARVELNWAENLDLIGVLERGHYDSNLPSADYNETRITFSGRLRF